MESQDKLVTATSLSDQLDALKKGGENERVIWSLSLCVLLLLGVVELRSSLQAAEKYPQDRSQFIIPVEAGSDADLLARPIAQKASTLLGQPMTFEPNRGQE